MATWTSASPVAYLRHKCAEIRSTGNDVAKGIEQGGSAIVGALNSVAQAIYNAIGGLGAGGRVAARSRGALSDGGYAAAAAAATGPSLVQHLPR